MWEEVRERGDPGLVSGVWCLVSGVWCLVSGAWCLVPGGGRFNVPFTRACVCAGCDASMHQFTRVPKCAPSSARLTGRSPYAFASGTRSGESKRRMRILIHSKSRKMAVLMVAS